MGAVEGISELVAADLDPDLLLPRLDPFPQIVVANPKIGNLDDLPLIPRVGPRDPFAVRGPLM